MITHIDTPIILIMCIHAIIEHIIAHITPHIMIIHIMLVLQNIDHRITHLEPLRTIHVLLQQAPHQAERILRELPQTLKVVLLKVHVLQIQQLRQQNHITHLLEAQQNHKEARLREHHKHSLQGRSLM